jgi:hypothetical protein
MARRDPHQHRPGLLGDALARGDPLPRGEHGESAGGRDAAGVEPGTDHGLAQHRSQRRLPVAAAGEGSAAGALEVEVAAAPVGIDEVTEEHGAAVAEHGVRPAELVPGVGLSGGALDLPGEQDDPLGAAQVVRVEAELAGELLVEVDELGRGRRLGAPGDRELRDLGGVGLMDLGHGSPLRPSSPTRLRRLALTCRARRAKMIPLIMKPPCGMCRGIVRGRAER